jgi:hypothetical protein
VNRIASINVDVDGLHLYYRIHGLSEDAAPGRGAIYTTGMSRFVDLLGEHGMRGTFFVVAEDLRDPAAREVVSRAVDEGHEIASHSHTHPYDLIRQDRAAMTDEIVRAEEAIGELTGSAPSGFRAPGYNTSPALLEILAERGYRYDSSSFPSTPYYLAKAAVLGWYALRGRASESILGSPRILTTSRLPHVIDTAAGPLLELPVTVLPWTRFPLIGTSLIAMGSSGWRMVRPFVKGVPFVNLEFHAIDLTDHAGDNIDDALLRQPDQRTPLTQKKPLFDEVLRFLKDGWQIKTLEEVANAYTSSS